MTNDKNFIMLQPDQTLTAEDIFKLDTNFILTREKNVIHLYTTRDLLRYLFEKKSVSVAPADIEDHAFDIIDRENPLNFVSTGCSYAIVVDEEDEINAVLETPELFGFYNRAMEHRLTNLNRRIANLKRILNVMEDEVFITDEYGFVQFINPRGEAVMGIRGEDYIGCHVSEMVKKDILPKSLTQQVIDRGERRMEIIDLPTGIRIICSAQPVYDENGKLVQVLSTSKNIDEITDKIEELSKKLRSSDEQIKALQMQVIEKKQYIFESPPMKELRKKLMQIAPTDVTVLIEGESGVGKEVVADTIYQLSARKEKPFVKINCGLIPKDLMESELFGYEAGAFTGALKNGKIGKIELANKGTLFLDEIGELPLPLQVKLLEFLQDHKICRVGGTNRIGVDIRVIAATNRNLFAMVEEGAFRRDLFYRLNVMPFYVPPLRERREDIVPLLFHFLNLYNKKYGFDRHIDNNVVEKMQNYGWPGNVRELMHAVERIVVASESDYISDVLLDDLFTEEITVHGTAISANAKVICTELMPLKKAKDELAKYLVNMAYERFGSSYKAAEYLQVNQSTVSRWLKRDDAKKH